MDSIDELLWRVFREKFKDGEEVVVEDFRGQFHYGRLRSFDDHIEITRPRCAVALKWWEVEFVAHDGFPVRKLRSMTFEEAERRASQTPDQLIRDAFDGKVALRGRRLGGGCPFVIGDASPTRIINRGSLAVWDNSVETMEFVAPDGAAMHSYCTSHLFLLAG